MTHRNPATAPTPAEPHPAVLLGEAVARLLAAMLAPWGLWRLLPGGRALHAMLTQFGRDFAALMARLATAPIAPISPSPRARAPKRRVTTPRQDSVRRAPRRRTSRRATTPRATRPGFPPPPRAQTRLAMPPSRPLKPAFRPYPRAG